MIRIDDDIYRKRGFSGRVVVSFQKGEMKQIVIEETVNTKDPERKNKLLKNGIHLDSSPDGAGNAVNLFSSEPGGQG